MASLLPAQSSCFPGWQAFAAEPEAVWCSSSLIGSAPDACTHCPLINEKCSHAVALDLPICRVSAPHTHSVTDPRVHGGCSLVYQHVTVSQVMVICAHKSDTSRSTGQAGQTFPGMKVLWMPSCVTASVSTPSALS